MYRRFNKGLLQTVSQEMIRATTADLVVESIYIVNTDTSNRTYSIFHIAADESEDDSFALFHEVILRPDTTHVLCENAPIYLRPGERLTAKASVADKLALTMYGGQAY
jgi:hypothetical protein